VRMPWQRTGDTKVEQLEGALCSFTGRDVTDSGRLPKLISLCLLLLPTLHGSSPCMSLWLQSWEADAVGRGLIRNGSNSGDGQLLHCTNEPKTQWPLSRG
jgi:hypothetical protein